METVGIRRAESESGEDRRQEQKLEKGGVSREKNRGSVHVYSYVFVSLTSYLVTPKLRLRSVPFGFPRNAIGSLSDVALVSSCEPLTFQRLRRRIGSAPISAN
jgi:hypothetical protein